MMSTPLSLLLSISLLTTPPGLLQPVKLGGDRSLKSELTLFPGSNSRISAWLSLKPSLTEFQPHARNKDLIEREKYIRDIYFSLSLLTIYTSLTRNTILQSLTNCKREILFTRSRERNAFTGSLNSKRNSLRVYTYASWNVKRNSLNVLQGHSRNLGYRFSQPDFGVVVGWFKIGLKKESNRWRLAVMLVW